MTIFAGAYVLDAQGRVPAALRAELETHLRTQPDSRGRLWTLDRPACFIVGWDSGAFEPGVHAHADGGATLLAGDPLLCEEGRRLARDKQSRRLHDALAGDADASTLRACRGSFALADYLATPHRLTLGTDAVGLRAVYYTVQSGVLVFATALRVLEATGSLRRSLDADGMAEVAAFSFPLAERTPYREIKILRESELLRAQGGSTTLQTYGDWEHDPGVAEDEAQAAADIYQHFQEAVALRAGADRRVYSFLSGGMDSRSIVATLLADGRQIEALNFSATASQDQFYAQQFAAQVPEQLRLHCLAGGIFPNFSFLALAAKTELEARSPTGVDRPAFIWSGDGGSVGLGHVYMDERVIELAEQSGMAAAARHYLEFNRVALPVGILRSQARERLPEHLSAAVLAEMERYPRADVGRQIYLFLLFNDQRRHLFKHFETIDQHGLELLTPFYDACFLRAVAATPARWGILHRLYARWFEHLPAYARATPWQTYPGHVPCPVPSPPTGSYQWANRAQARREALSQRLRTAAQMLDASQAAQPDPALSTARIGLAAGLHALGLKDCRHVLAVLQTYARHAAFRN